MIQPFRLSEPARALVCSCVFGLAVKLQAQVPARFPVMPEQVLLAMQGLDLPVAGVQLRLAAPVTATVAEPLLKIDFVSLGTGHEAMLRMACRVHTECLPFFASAAWPTDAPMPDLLAKSASRNGSGFSGHTPEPRTKVFPDPLAGSSSAPVPPAIRAGGPATLLLEGGRIHIQIHVISAQNGRVGDTVRVTTPDRKQVYVAEVLTPELLKGEL